MGKGLLIMFILGTLCVSACGNVQKKVSPVELSKPQKLIVDETKTDALAKLQELKKVSEKNYKLADNNTHVIELRNRNMAKLKNYRLQVEKEAEESFSVQRKQIEEEYRLKIFNLQMQLESLKLRAETRNKLKEELSDILSERDGRLTVLEERKQNYISEKMRAYKAEM